MTYLKVSDYPDNIKALMNDCASKKLCPFCFKPLPSESASRGVKQVFCCRKHNSDFKSIVSGGGDMHETPEKDELKRRLGIYIETCKNM